MLAALLWPGQGNGAFLKGYLGKAGLFTFYNSGEAGSLTREVERW
jgi:hypothetical protein